LLFRQLIDVLAGGCNACARFIAETDGFVVSGNSDNIIDG
jgi:hypothetical protein